MTASTSATGDTPRTLGGRELQYGRYDLRIEALRRAKTYAVNPEALYRTEFNVMRELDVSAFALGDFLQPLGLPRAQYRGFDQVERVMQGDSLRTGLARLAAHLSAGSAADEAPDMLLVADALARGAAGDAADGMGAGAPAVLLGKAKAHMEAGQLDRAYECLGRAMRGTTHLREVNALLGRYFQRRGNMIAAASAYHVALLNLGPASGLNRPFGLEMDYKAYRILQLGRRFCAFPRWRDARVHLVGGRPTIVAHRLPQGLRRWFLRRAPRRLVEWARQHLLRYFLTSKLRSRGVIEADDLVTIMRQIDSAA